MSVRTANPPQSPDPSALMALLTAPRPVDTALRLAMVPALFARARYALWWGVAYYALGLFVRVERAMLPRETRAPIQVAGRTITDLLSGVVAERLHVARVVLAEIAASVSGSSAPWVVLVGLPAPGDEMVVQREALERLVRACMPLARPGVSVQAWAQPGDLTLASQGAELVSVARTVVVDGGDWRGLLTEVIGVRLEGDELHVNFGDVDTGRATRETEPELRLPPRRASERRNRPPLLRAPLYVVEAEVGPSWSVSGTDDPAHMEQLVAGGCVRAQQCGEGLVRVTSQGRTELAMRCVGDTWRML